MVFVAVHVMTDEFKIQAGAADFLQPHVEGIVIRIPLIALIKRIGFGFIGRREGVDTGIQARKTEIHMIETATGTVVLNVFPVVLMT